MIFINETMLKKINKNLQTYKIDFRISLFIYAVLTLFGLYKTKKHTLIIKDLTNPIFLLMFIGMSLFILYFHNYGSPTAKEATKHAISAWIIAYLAHLDLTFAAFAFVWILYYFGYGD